MIGKPLEERFWGSVARGSNDECWPWNGSLNTNGYGVINAGGTRGRTLMAHRVAYELIHGPIPAEMTLDHLCRNRRCVNPLHLEPVTSAVNILRSESPAALNARKTHCAAGHPFDEENTYVRPGGGRTCRECARQRDVARRAAGKVKEYYAANRERVLARHQDYYAANRERLLARSIAYAAANREKRLAYFRERYRLRKEAS